MSVGLPEKPVRRRGPEPPNQAIFLYGSDLISEEDIRYAAFENKRTTTVAGVAYPTEGSRSPVACGRALDIAVNCFLDRPSVADGALQMISRFVDEEISVLQEKDREYMCSLATLYIFKGRARICAMGYSAVLFFEEGRSEIWYGDSVPAGSLTREDISFPGELELDADCRFVFITGINMDTVGEAVSYFEESRGEDTEGMKTFFSDKHASYVNLFLPKREKRGFFR